MAKQKRSPGDGTGKQADKLAAEAAAAQKEREAELSMATAAAERRRDEGVIDYSEPNRPRLEEPGVADAEAFREQQAATLSPGTRQVGTPGTEVDDAGVLYLDGENQPIAQTNDTQILGKGVESPSAVMGGAADDEVVRRSVDQQNKAQRLPSNEVTDLGVEQAGDDLVEIRVNADLENVTIGIGNEYNFEEGMRYRVPRHVADHLEEKGYVWH